MVKKKGLDILLSADKPDLKNIKEIKKQLIEEMEPLLEMNFDYRSSEVFWQIYAEQIKGKMEAFNLISANQLPELILKNLAGLETAKAWKIREEIWNFYKKSEPLTQTHCRQHYLWSLVGLDSPRAWVKRNELFAREDNPFYKLVALAGLDSPRSWQVRDEIGESSLPGLIKSLTGLNSPRAWAKRRQILKINQDGGSDYTDNLASTLIGLDSDEAWEFRKQIKAASRTSNINQYLSMGLTGTDSDEAWEMRDEFLSANFEPYWILIGLGGCNSERAWQFRDENFYATNRITGARKSEAYLFLGLSLAGLNSEKAWEMRKKLMEMGDTEQLLDSLTGGYEMNMKIISRVKKESEEKNR